MKKEFDNSFEKDKKGCAILGPSWTSLPFKQNEQEPGCIWLKLMLSSMISDLINQGVRDFYTTCEYGAPLWAAEAVMNMSRLTPCHLHIVMPYEEQASGWPEDIRDRFFYLHENSADVILVDTCPTPETENLCIIKLLENSSVILCSSQEKAKYAKFFADTKAFEYI